MTPRILVMVIGAIIGALVSTPVQAQAKDARVLPRPMKVAEAIQYLGSSAATVASDAGHSLARWRKEANDPHAWIGPTGGLYFVDPAPAKPPKGKPTSEPAPYPYAQTFLLHSNPSATRKIFLDFDGHSVTDSAWSTGTLTAPAYTADGDPAFSQAEQDLIQDAWARVAEDFAPFNVDVTTEDPGYAGLNRASSSDTTFGTRLVITANTSSVYSVVCPGGCGGVAYVGTIDFTGINHDYYQPAWVFTSTAKSIAEAASHEAGHNLGLSHDGTASLGYYRGHGAWAPIMGVGYDRPVTQWSKGEYSGANNAEDDFVVAGQNQIPLRTDDHGGPASATAVTGPDFSASGVIHSAADTDAFSFTTGGGTVSVSADPATVSPNLDIKLSLLDQSGAVVASNDPAVAMVNANSATGLDAAINTTVPGGTYRVVVDGIGFGSAATTGYSDYGSVGVYSLAGSFPVAGGNIAPNAVASATPTTGNAPLTVSYSSAGSSDPDGTIASYSWSFSDGTTSTAANPTKTWNAAGTHTATLVVTDNAGATSAPSVVTVNATTATVIKVQAMSMTIRLTNGRRQASTTVTVTDQNGNLVSGVSVTGSYTGLGAVTRTGTTGTNGQVVLTSTRVSRSSGTFTFTIGSLNKAGTTYNAAGNLISTISRSF